MCTFEWLLPSGQAVSVPFLGLRDHIKTLPTQQRKTKGAYDVYYYRGYVDHYDLPTWCSMYIRKNVCRSLHAVNR